MSGHFCIILFLIWKTKSNDGIGDGYLLERVTKSCENYHHSLVILKVEAVYIKFKHLRKISKISNQWTLILKNLNLNKRV